MYHYMHELYLTEKAKLVMLDICDTPDCGLEGAYALFDQEAFEKAWYADTDEPYYYKDVKECGEDFNAFSVWFPVVHGKNPKVIEKKLKHYVDSL